MADDCEDTGRHAPNLQNRDRSRACREESAYAYRVTLEERLQGHRHHACANAGDPSFTALASSLHAGAHLLGYGAPRLRDAVAALGRRAVGGRAHTDLQALGEG